MKSPTAQFEKWRSFLALSVVMFASYRAFAGEQIDKSFATPTPPPLSVSATLSQPAGADDPAHVTLAPYDWSGFYFGGHLGYAWGSSNWTAASGTSGSINFAQTIDNFDEAGSFFGGFQGGYNYLLPNRFLIGAEVDTSFPSFQTLSGISIGGTSTFTSPTLGAESYSETVLSSGTVRLRLGYAPGNWLFYATGGFAWTYDQLSLTRLATGATLSPSLVRVGWAAGAGVEIPIMPHWTARLEYLFTDYGHTTHSSIASDLSLQEVRLGLNYQFGRNPLSAAQSSTAPAMPTWMTWIMDNVNFHGQTTFLLQGYPPIRSPYEGTQSLPGGGEVRETWDAGLFAGARLWPGAELWVNPEIDQGFGLANTHGVAGFTTGTAYKLGFASPYARVQRYFIRQTIDLGGAAEEVHSDISQFAGSQTANRLVLTVGRFFVVDIFDTNQYANDPRSNFLNWSVINANSFDFAGDAWSSTYGGVAEWYQGPWTLRAGIFDMSATPAGGADSAPSYGLDPTFSQFELVGEIEGRYKLWDQPGTIKTTGFLIRGRMGNFDEALALYRASGLDASDALAAVRYYQSRPGVSLNLAQQVTDTVGVFGRAGLADGNVEPWDNTDCDRTIEAGVSLGGKCWKRPDDTVGIAGVINGISNAHMEYFNAGGLGIVIGDGRLPHYGLEQIIETYYSYAVSPSAEVSLDYQFIRNPAYNTDRGPANVFALRLHLHF
jgi:high affinity Mn2+ porin